MAKVTLKEATLTVARDVYPIIYLPGHARSFESVTWTTSPKFTDKWKPYVDVLAQFCDSNVAADVSTKTLRFSVDGKSTPYLVHYGERASDSSGCLLIGYPATVPLDYQRFMQLASAVEGFNRWNARALFLNLLIYKSLNKE